jgi:hypothetical protein
MRKKYVKRMDKQPSPAQNTLRKPLLLILPRRFSLELDNLFFLRRLSPVRTPTLKSALRIGLNLFSVMVVVVAIWFMLSEALINAYTGIELTRSSKSLNCAEIKSCVAQSGNTPTITPGGVIQIQSPFVQATSVATSIPTWEPTPKPITNSTLPPTVTPVSVFLKVTPTGLNVSLATVCDKGQSVTLMLTNAGGAPLVWFQNIPNSSPGISISDPTKTHLLQSGQSVNAKVNCLSKLVVGNLYTLAIDYNGGTVVVVVKIKL